MLATARERLAAGEPPAALGPGGYVVGNNGADGERFRVVPPDVDLPLLRQAGDDPFQFGKHAVDPPSGRTATGECLDRLQEDAHRGLMTPNRRGRSRRRRPLRRKSLIVSAGMFRAAVAAASRPASTVTNLWARARNSAPEGVTLGEPDGVSDDSSGILGGRS